MVKSAEIESTCLLRFRLDALYVSARAFIYFSLLPSDAFFSSNSSLERSKILHILSEVHSASHRKLPTEFYPLRFMAQVQTARAISRGGKNEDL